MRTLHRSSQGRVRTAYRSTLSPPFLYPSATLPGSSSWADLSGARSPSNRLQLYRPREPSRVYAGECAPGAQRARGLFGRVSSRHGGRTKRRASPVPFTHAPNNDCQPSMPKAAPRKRRAAPNPHTPRFNQGQPAGRAVWGAIPALPAGCPVTTWATEPEKRSGSGRPRFRGRACCVTARSWACSPVARPPSPSLPPLRRLGCGVSAACGGKDGRRGWN